MTAINLVIQPNAGAAYLLTDTAEFSGGVVVGFRQKFIPLSIGGHWCAAVALAGTTSGADFIEAMKAAHESSSGGCFNSVDQFIAGFPAIFRSVERSLVDRACDPAFRPKLAALIALYDHAARAPRGYAIGNGFTFPTHHYRAYTLQPILKSLTRFAGRPFPRGTDMCNPQRWNPITDATRLIEAQRLDPFGADGEAYFGVGGEAHLTLINANGIKVDVVRKWPDKIGERIDPQANTAVLQAA